MADCGTLDTPLYIAEVDYDGRTEAYLGLVLAGTPEERGLTYGRWLRDKIKANVARHLGHPNLPAWYVFNSHRGVGGEANRPD
jgi:isopenicillin-N N-acyltransferase-like protein